MGRGLCSAVSQVPHPLLGESRRPDLSCEEGVGQPEAPLSPALGTGGLSLRPCGVQPVSTDSAGSEQAIPGGAPAAPRARKLDLAWIRPGSARPGPVSSHYAAQPLSAMTPRVRRCAARLKPRHFRPTRPRRGARPLLSPAQGSAPRRPGPGGQTAPPPAKTWRLGCPIRVCSRRDNDRARPPGRGRDSRVAGRGQLVVGNNHWFGQRPTRTTDSERRPPGALGPRPTTDPGKAGPAAARLQASAIAGRAVGARGCAAGAGARRPRLGSVQVQVQEGVMPCKLSTLAKFGGRFTNRNELCARIEA